MKTPMFNSGVMSAILDPRSLDKIFGARVAPDGDLVRDKFAAWFGASKVLGFDGSPLVVFHGTADDISAFDEAQVGKRHLDLGVGSAFFFTSDLLTANWYAESSSGMVGGGGNVMAVYLSLQTPLIIDFQGTGIETLAEDIVRAKAEGYDGLVALDYDDGRIGNHYIAFDANQVKSALGYCGFDGALSDMFDRQADAGAGLLQPVRERVRA